MEPNLILDHAPDGRVRLSILGLATCLTVLNENAKYVTQLAFKKVAMNQGVTIKLRISSTTCSKCNRQEVEVESVP